MNIKKSWLEKEITYEEAIDYFSDYSEAKLLHHLRDSDQIWWWTTPRQTWAALAGRSGICVVRDGEILDSRVLVMN